jgi:hypothetical protein
VGLLMAIARRGSSSPFIRISLRFHLVLGLCLDVSRCVIPQVRVLCCLFT